MFGWIRRLLPISKEEKRRRFLEEVDAFNAQLYGGAPTVIRQSPGHLTMRSGTLALCDPQHRLPTDGSNLQVPEVTANEVAISARLWRYPSGFERLIALTLRLADETVPGPSRKIGEIDIESQKLVVADQADLEEFWAEAGPDRIGVISTATDDAVLRLLTQRFNLRTIRVNAIRAEVVGPVPEALENEIEEYLKSIPKYADFPYIHFRVETSNSFDRANRMDKAWDFIPIGKEHEPLMFVCGTGRGDGFYDVHCTFSGDIPQVLTIEFVEAADSRAGPA